MPSTRPGPSRWRTARCFQNSAVGGGANTLFERAPGQGTAGGIYLAAGVFAGTNLTLVENVALTNRLPTEAEWEYACRAGTTNRFSFGDALECSDVREPCDLLSLHLWWGGNNGKGGQPRGCKPVGLKLPNPWGLHDVHGNVWEWCSDGWEMPTPRGSRTDPHGPHEATLRVMRGGAWESHALHLRSADRSPMGPEDREYGRLIGLRIVREAPAHSGGLRPPGKATPSLGRRSSTIAARFSGPGGTHPTR